MCLSWCIYPKIRKAKGERGGGLYRNNFVYVLGHLNKLLCIYAFCLLDVINTIEFYLSLILLAHKAFQSVHFQRLS